MTEVQVGMVVEASGGDPAGAKASGRPLLLHRLRGARLSYSGGRGVIETPEAEALRATLADLDAPFVVEQGRLGLEGCRLDPPERESFAPTRGWLTRRMSRTRLPRNAVAFSYTGIYDTAEVETLRPPPPQAEGRGQRSSWL
ncbi:MAG: hypothetical protein KC731_20590 [Myxococcales bacterium]|nr:hypothetical protein [Myxococcales bacterium]